MNPVPGVLANDPELSVIVPMYNEGENVARLCEEIAGALRGRADAYQVVLVDDGSSDNTWACILEAQRRDSHVHGLRHARRCGQSAALWTGIQGTSSPLIATLDGDGQNDPASFPQMLEMLGDADMVCGVRVKRQDRWLRKVSAAIARWARGLVLGSALRDVGCGLRVFRREALEGVFGFNGLHRFLPILAAGGGFRVVETPVNHRPRLSGVSKYGVWNRALRGAVDLFAIAWYQRRRFGSVVIAESTSAARVARSTVPRS